MMSVTTTWFVNHQSTSTNTARFIEGRDYVWGRRAAPRPTETIEVDWHPTKDFGIDRESVHSVVLGAVQSGQFLLLRTTALYSDGTPSPFEVRVNGSGMEPAGDFAGTSVVLDAEPVTVSIGLRRRRAPETNLILEFRGLPASAERESVPIGLVEREEAVEILRGWWRSAAATTRAFYSAICNELLALGRSATAAELPVLRKQVDRAIGGTWRNTSRNAADGLLGYDADPRLVAAGRVLGINDFYLDSKASLTTAPAYRRSAAAAPAFAVSWILLRSGVIDADTLDLGEKLR